MPGVVKYSYIQYLSSPLVIHYFLHIAFHFLWARPTILISSEDRVKSVFYDLQKFNSVFVRNQEKQRINICQEKFTYFVFQSNLIKPTNSVWKMLPRVFFESVTNYLEQCHMFHKINHFFFSYACHYGLSIYLFYLILFCWMSVLTELYFHRRIIRLKKVLTLPQ